MPLATSPVKFREVTPTTPKVIGAHIEVCLFTHYPVLIVTIRGGWPGQVDQVTG